MSLIQEVEIASNHTLEDYSSHAMLAQLTRELMNEAQQLAPRLQGKTVWMLNSTPTGGGVAEMLPKLVHLMRQLGVDARWCAIAPKEPAFFNLTKRLHNAIHGVPGPSFSADDKHLFDKVSAELNAEFLPRLKPQDVVIAHDPQPAGLVSLLKSQLQVKTIWRCHIGLETESPTTHGAWEFLRPYLQTFDHSVFSAPAYIAPFLSKNVSIIQPAIDPLSHKNRPLHPVKMAGVLSNAGLIHTDQPSVTPPFVQPVRRLDPEGQFRTLNGNSDIGLLFRPIITQISRWDHLKGYLPLMEGFAKLKRSRINYVNERHQNTIDQARIVLAGPEPDAVKDDPEAVGVLEEVIAAYRRLPEELKPDVAVLSLPMASIKFNALIVNSLQRVSRVVVQNSIREGFGLAVTEAMWKPTPTLGSRAYGIRQQIREGLDGGLIAEPSDPTSVAQALNDMLKDPLQLETYARNGEKRVYDEFLIFRQLSRWLRLLAELH